MQEKSTLTLYLADKEVNNLMRAFDMCPAYKVFIMSKEKISFKTEKVVNEEYIRGMIEKSREEKNFWVPAIEHDGILYVASEIQELSDGNNVAFLGAK